MLSEALSRALQYANENPVQIILLMLTTYYVVSAFGSVTENNRDPLQNLFDELEESDVHFKDVTSDITSCAQKKIGKNIGMTCSITQEDGTDTKYYLKKIHDNNAFKFYNNPLFSGYHQRFVQSVGLMTPTFEYHKIINFQNDYEYFLASKEVKGFKPANQISKDELHLLFSKNNNMAKFSVICTLLQDFHRQNYGFVDDQLVLIDLDMTARQGETQQDDFKNCCYGASREINKNVPNLTLEAVEKMIGIYQKLKTKKIPAFHPRFDMSNELYQALLSTYILACEDLVHDLKSMPAEELRNEMIMNKRYINLMLSYSFVSRANLLEEEFDKHPAIRELSCSIDRLKKP